MNVTCDSDLVISPEGFIQCPTGFGLRVGDPTASLDNLTELLSYLFTFNAEFFGLILLGFILAFIKGWGLGIVVRLLGKS